MKKNFTVLFIFLFIASIAMGLGLKNVFEYSMTFGVGLSVIFLLFSIYFENIRRKKIKTQ